MKLLNTLKQGLLVLAALLVVSNVLLPAIARAQFVAEGGATAGAVLAALLGQTVSAERYVATASTGAAFSASTVLACSVDLGPGTENCLGTDGSGAILAGPAAGTGTTQRLQVGAGFWVDASGTQFLTSRLLDTCDASREFQEANDKDSGDSTGTRSRRCLCTSDGAATPAYAWVNLASGTVGTATTCPP